MGLMALVRRLYNLHIQSENLRYGTLPTSADGAAAAALTLTANAAGWTFGAWVEIVAAAGITVETLITSFTLENFVGVAGQGEIEIGTGGAGAEAATGRFSTVQAGKDLPQAIRIPAATRVAARYRSSNAVADTVDIKLGRLTGF